MREQEKYWARKSPPTPEFRDLPPGTMAETWRGFDSLSPGFRRTIWREAVHAEARKRGLPDEIIRRLKVATIDGSIPDLDGYLEVFAMQDERRPSLPEDQARLERADAMHQKSAVQIAAREAV
jgi:hypothetical protein